MKRSSSVIIRSFIMYKPLKFFGTIGSIALLLGAAIGIRFLYYFVAGSGNGHIQSLILAAVFILMGVQMIILGLQGDIIAANRKLLEDIQYRIRKMDCEDKK